MTPKALHYGLAEGIQAERKQTLLQADARHPECFVRKLPVPPSLPGKVWINPPKEAGKSFEVDSKALSDGNELDEELDVITQHLKEEVLH